MRAPLRTRHVSKTRAPLVTASTIRARPLAGSRLRARADAARALWTRVVPADAPALTVQGVCDVPLVLSLATPPPSAVPHPVCQPHIYIYIYTRTRACVVCSAGGVVCCSALMFCARQIGAVAQGCYVQC